VNKREVFNVFHAAVCALGSVLLLAGETGVGTVVWLLGWLFIAWRVVAVGRAGNFGDRLGAWTSARLLLVLGLAGPVVHSSPAMPALAWVALALFAVSVRTESLVRRVGRYRGLRVANVPGVDTGGAPDVLLVVLAVLQHLVVPVLLLLGLFGQSGAWWLVAVLPSLVVAAVVVGSALSRRTHSRRLQDELPAALERLAPRFVLYWDAPKGSAYQVAMWLPYLERIGQPYLVMVRNVSAFTDVTALSSTTPVVLARSIADIGRCVPSSLTTAFYVNNAATNTHLVRYGNLTHVQLLHGDSDKVASYNPVTVMFDKIYVAGQAGINRYLDHGVDIPLEKFEIVGRPQVEAIGVAEVPLPELDRVPVVLYAPTWRGNQADADYSSLPQAPELFEQLLARGCSIVFRPHPYCQRDPEFRDVIAQLHERLAQHSKETGTRHRYGAEAEVEMSVTDCFNACDAMISDVSGVVADFLYSEKPFALVAGAADPDRFVQEFPLAKASYLLCGETEQWVTPLARMFESDPMAETRRSARVHYLGNFDRDHYAEAFVTVATRQVGLVKDRRRPPYGQRVDTPDQGVVDTETVPERDREPELAEIEDAAE